MVEWVALAAKEDLAKVEWVVLVVGWDKAAWEALETKWGVDDKTTMVAAGPEVEAEITEVEAEIIMQIINKAAKAEWGKAEWGKAVKVAWDRVDRVAWAKVGKADRDKADRDKAAKAERMPQQAIYTITVTCSVQHRTQIKCLRNLQCLQNPLGAYLHL